MRGRSAHFAGVAQAPAFFGASAGKIGSRRFWPTARLNWGRLAFFCDKSDEGHLLKECLRLLTAI
jgi:hypothetical protein